MDTRVAQWIEEVVSVVAAAILATAVAFALGQVTKSTVTIGAGAAASLLVVRHILRSIGSNEQALALALFEPAELTFDECDELLLTEADRVDPSSDNGVLVLEDVLTEPGDEAKVVRLFDASTMPTPGELRARIDRHLNHAHAQNRASDASGALHDALAELRRSLK